MKSPVLLYIVRHGETSENDSNRFRSQSMEPIDERGREQARAAARRLANVPFKFAWSSDLPRAAETMNIILGAREIPRQNFMAMRPWNVGIFGGQEKNEVSERGVKWYVDHPSVGIPDGESLDEFRQRYKTMFTSAVNLAKHNAPALLVQHATTDHEAGHILYDDINALDVEPGGIIAIFPTPEGLVGEALSPKAKQYAGYGYS